MPPRAADGPWMPRLAVLTPPGSRATHLVPRLKHHCPTHATGRAWSAGAQCRPDVGGATRRPHDDREPALGDRSARLGVTCWREPTRGLEPLTPCLSPPAYRPPSSRRRRPDRVDRRCRTASPCSSAPPPCLPGHTGDGEATGGPGPPRGGE